MVSFRNPGKRRTCSQLLVCWALCWGPVFAFGLWPRVWRLGLGGFAFVLSCALVALALALSYAATVLLDPGVYATTRSIESAPSGERYCDKCRHVPPWGTKHCERCERCIVGMDHHCTVVDSCIGEGNQQYFELMANMFCANYFMIIAAVGHSVAAAIVKGNSGERVLRISCGIFASIGLYLLVSGLVTTAISRFKPPRSRRRRRRGHAAAADAEEDVGDYDDYDGGGAPVQRRLVVFRLPRRACCCGASYPQSLGLVEVDEEEEDGGVQPAILLARAYLAPIRPVVQSSTLPITGTVIAAPQL